MHLLPLMENQKNNTGKIISFLSTDRAILIISIGIALVFWWLTKMSKVYTTFRSVGIEYQLPEGKVFAETPRTSFLAEVESSGWNLFYSYLGSGLPPIEFILNGNEFQEIYSGQLINSLNAKVGKQYEIKSVDTDRISIRLDNSTSVKVPVRISGAFQAAEGYMQTGKPRLFPDSIIVIGPTLEVSQIKEWRTNFIDAQTQKEGFEEEVELRRPSNQEIRLVPETIQCIWNVERATEGSVVVPIEIENAPDSVSVFPPKAFVTYRAPLSIYQKIDSDDFKIVRDFSSLNSGDGKNTAAIELSKSPDNVRVIDLNPPTFEYYIVKTDTISGE